MNNKLYIFTREIFYVLLTTLIILSVMELIAPNIAQAYINMNALLILWLLSGIITVVSSKF